MSDEEMRAMERMVVDGSMTRSQLRDWCNSHGLELSILAHEPWCPMSQGRLFCSCDI